MHSSDHFTGGGKKTTPIFFFPARKKGPTSAISTMSPSITPPAWIRAWFFISSFVVLWDAAYCLLRPHTMKGGKWNLLWRPYNLYAQVDTFYGVVALEEQDGFTSAQAIMNLVETTINFIYLGMLASGKPDNLGRANLVGFSAATLTCAKTVLYMLNEVFSGMRHTRHNSLQDFILLWTIPNGTWIVFPSLIMFSLGRDLFDRLGPQKSKTL
ncbi:hypothetical protein BX666DRAFT_1982837 [Dichotomocladium elegans]|nr:hypothetical protein BX666DRAFT_1982837 [Dichotomocladium elegans]